jgi:hypothetical protein
VQVGHTRGQPARGLLAVLPVLRRVTAPLPRAGRVTILVAALLLTGCSTLALVYNRAPTLAFWQIDDYLDLDKSQAPGIRAAIRTWFAWHRAEEVPRYAKLVSSLRAEVMAPASAARICAVNDELRDAFNRALARALPALPALAHTLSARQRAHLARRYAESNAELRETYLDGSPEARRARTLERALDAARDFYGRLDASQRQLIADGIAASPYDPSRWLAERETRQQEMLALLARIAASEPARRNEVASEGFTRYAANLAHSPRQPYRDYLASLTRYNCEFIARVHASTSTRQRARAARRLEGWERDLTAILGG